jgi:diadenosine tetraphosphate (Ap4A) HIT family hydrolase
VTAPAGDGCLLCDAGWRKERALYRGRGWWVVPHPTPAAGALRHLQVLPEQHAADLLDLPSWVLQSMWDVLKWVRGAYKLDFYGLVTRAGQYPDGAVHAHTEVIVGDVHAPGHRGVRVELGQPAGTGR